MATDPKLLVRCARGIRAVRGVSRFWLASMATVGELGEVTFSEVDVERLFTICWSRHCVASSRAGGWRLRSCWLSSASRRR